MRISADRDDPDYFGDDGFGRFIVKLDGVPQHGVRMADDVAGVIDIVDRQPSRIFGRLQLTRKQGRVEIIDGRARA